MALNHFSPSELKCKCGCGLDVITGTPFHERLNELRARVGIPLHVSSATRCPRHNSAVSSTGFDGPHTVGAVDIACFGALAWRVLLIALDMGFKGIGVKQSGPHGARFIHLDDLPAAPGRPRPTVWSYP